MRNSNRSIRESLNISFRMQNTSTLRYGYKLEKELDNSYTLYRHEEPIFRISQNAASIRVIPGFSRSLLYSLLNDLVADSHLVKSGRLGYKLSILGERGVIPLKFNQWTTIARSERQKRNYPLGTLDEFTLDLSTPRPDVAPLIALALRQRRSYVWPPDYQIKREGRAMILLYKERPVLRLTSMHCQICAPVDPPIELRSLLSTLLRTLAEGISPVWRRDKLWTYKGKLRVLKPARPQQWTTFYASENTLPRIKEVADLHISVVRYTPYGEFYWLIDRTTEEGTERIGSGCSFATREEALEHAKDYTRHYYPLERVMGE